MDISDRHSFRRRVGMVIVALASLAWAGLALAQIPDAAKLPGSVQPAVRAPPAASIDPEKLRSRIEVQLGQLRERLERAGAGKEPPAPAGISTGEIESARNSLALLVQIYGAQLDALAQFEKQSKAREAAERAENTWSGFKEQPPYSILLWDDVREEVKNNQMDVVQLKSSRAVATAEADRFRDRAERAEEAMRRAADERTRASPGSNAYALANWRLDAARDESAVAAALVGSFSFSSREIDEKSAIAQAQLRLAQRKLAALTGKVRISKSDLEEARKRLGAARAQQEKELQSLVAASVGQERERVKALKVLEALRSARPAAQARALNVAEAIFNAADARTRSLSNQIRILTVLVTVYYQDMLDAWERRYAVLAGDDPAARLRAKQQIDEMIDYLTGWETGIKVQRNDVRTQLQRQDAPDQPVLVDTEVQKYEREAREALRQLDLALGRQETLLAHRLVRLGFWREEFAEAMKARSLADISRDVLAQTRSITTAFWNYELLTIEDTVEVAGQVVATTRGVTVGKSLGAILLFLIGYRLMRFFSSRLERLLVRRFRVGAQQAKTLRRWADALGVLMLALLTLNLARIPLTIFAFAGGALAIGIGFGAQTLIKNLISGMIVLIERQIKVGDIVEVEGVTGTVTEVNIRSSTVRGFDGVESMIPNAMLLEQRVTNWTLSNSQLRRVVRVGVAYGSPVGEVAKLLADCADRHGVILKDPAPRVIFEDFGDNSLVFAVYFWINLTGDTNTMQVMSDLRFMIEKQLGEAGVVIAYPQRDVHLAASRPLQVEVITPGAAKA